MAATTTTNKNKTFVIVPRSRHAEVARTLAEPVPQALSLFDQFGLWGDLGVSPCSASPAPSSSCSRAARAPPSSRWPPR